MFKVLFCIFILISTSILFICKTRNREYSNTPPEEIKNQKPIEIDEYVFGYKSYDEIYEIFRQWESRAPNLVDIEFYGKTANQKDQYYLKIGNENCPSEKKVLITACIHGNEPWSTSTVIAYAGMLLSNYGKNETITDLVNNRTIYIVPVVSPDTYPTNRNVGRVDPNRNFPTLNDPNKISVTPVKNLQDLFLKIKPNSVLSGHTYGRVFLIPWGSSVKNNPNIQDYEKIAKTMCDLSGYRYQKACEMYGRPIYGTEIDWYHRQGAFAMVMEFGSHQRKPTIEETKKEFDRTKEAFLFFIKESVNVEIKQLL